MKSCNFWLKSGNKQKPSSPQAPSLTGKTTGNNNGSY